LPGRVDAGPEPVDEGEGVLLPGRHLAFFVHLFTAYQERGGHLPLDSLVSGDHARLGNWVEGVELLALGGGGGEVRDEGSDFCFLGGLGGSETCGVEF